MKYQGTIAYRTNYGAHIPEGFAFSLLQAYDFLIHEFAPPAMWVADQELRKLAADITPVNRFHLMRSSTCFPDESANQIAHEFLGDWVLSLDTDHVFAADALYEMITTFEEHKLDVLVGFAQKRRPPYHPIIYKTTFNPLVDFETIIPGALERQLLFPVDSSGGACLMVRRSVFEKIKAENDCPPFRRLSKFSLNDEIPPGRSVHELWGEDTSFFIRLKKVGIQAYCAPWIKFHHLADVMVTESMIVPNLPQEIPQ